MAPFETEHMLINYKSVAKLEDKILSLVGTGHSIPLSRKW